jgi:hypothetical protein
VATQHHARQGGGNDTDTVFHEWLLVAMNGCRCCYLPHDNAVPGNAIPGNRTGL